MKDFRSALVISFSIVAVALVACFTFFNRAKADDLISVTGSGSADFDSDLVVWTASFGATSYSLKTAYADLKANRDIVVAHLSRERILASEATFGAVSTRELSRRIYNASGEVTGEAFAGYRLEQEITLSSRDVDKIEKVSRNITELIDKGVEISSEKPKYFYTRLADLKLDLIARATVDARQRAWQVADNAGGYLGKVRYSSVGVFQINERNSSGETSWEGNYDTGSRLKTATVTVKVQYELR